MTTPKITLFIVTKASPESATGDTILLARYARQMEGKYATRMLSAAEFLSADLQSKDIVLVANLDIPERIFPIVYKVDCAHANLLLYTLYHPPEAVRDFFYYRSSLDRYFPVSIANSIYSFLQKINWIRKILVSPHLVEIVKAAGFSRNKLQGWCLRKSKCILVSSELEQRQIEKDFGEIDRVRICPHVPIDSNLQASNASGFVLVPGRIEKRKNLLQIALAVSFFPDEKFIFVGSKVDDPDEYQKKFFEQISACENASYISELPLNKFNEYLFASELVVSASWYEVMSLIDIDALYAGIPVVSTSHSYLPDSDLIFKCNPSDVKSIANAISKALHSKAEVVGKFEVPGESILSIVSEV